VRPKRKLARVQLNVRHLESKLEPCPTFYPMDIRQLPAQPLLVQLPALSSVHDSRLGFRDAFLHGFDPATADEGWP